MNYWLKHHLDYEIELLKSDLKLIALKQKPEEWKRDHYRYTFALHAQNIFTLLDSSITEDPVAPVSLSTKKELIVLRDLLNKIIK